VTGGSRGIGRAIAAALIAEPGMQVVLVARDEEALASSAAELGPAASFESADVSDAG
jgi:NAD(P)-dependent dehydrogenase (short-subunit alcohol dehydrogenase family)